MEEYTEPVEDIQEEEDQNDQKKEKKEHTADYEVVSYQVPKGFEFVLYPAP